MTMGDNTAKQPRGGPYLDDRDGFFYFGSTRQVYQETISIGFNEEDYFVDPTWRGEMRLIISALKGQAQTAGMTTR